jgi:hypothetical protein
MAGTQHRNSAGKQAKPGHVDLFAARAGNTRVGVYTQSMQPPSSGHKSALGMHHPILYRTHSAGCRVSQDAPSPAADTRLVSPVPHLRQPGTHSPAACTALLHTPLLHTRLLYSCTSQQPTQLQLFHATPALLHHTQPALCPALLCSCVAVATQSGQAGSCAVWA